MDNQRHDGAPWAADCSGSGPCAFGARPHRHLRPTSLVRPHAHSTRLTPSGFSGARLAVPSSTAQSSSLGGSSAESSGSTLAPSSASTESDAAAVSESQSTETVSGSTRTHGAWKWLGRMHASSRQPLGLQLQSYASSTSGKARATQRSTDEIRGGISKRSTRSTLHTCVPAEVRGCAHLVFAA